MAFVDNHYLKHGLNLSPLLMSSMFRLLPLMGLLLCFVGTPPAVAAGSVALELSDAQRRFIAEHPLIRVRYSDFPPFHFQERGEPRGISIELMDRVVELTGLKVEYVHDLNWPGALRAIGELRDFDVLLSAKRTPEREQSMRFTHDYLTLPWVIFTRDDGPFLTGIADLAGQRVLVERGYVMERVLRTKVPEARIYPIDGLASEALRGLASGRGDAYVGNLTVASYLIGRLGLSNIKVSAPAGVGDHTQAMAVRHDWPELVGILDAALSAIPARERAAQLQHWFTVKNEGMNRQQRLVWTGIVVLLVLLIVLVIAWNRTLRSAILKYKTANLEREQVESRTRDLLEHISSGVAVYQPIDDGRDFRIVEFNRAAEKINQVERNQVLGQRVTEAFPGVEEFGLLAVLRQVHQSHHPLDHPVTLYEDERITTWVENHVYAQPDGCIVAIHDDLTQSKLIHSDLVHRTKSLHRAQEIAHIGSWEWNINTNMILWSDEIYRIFGLEPQQFTPTYQAFLEHIHPDDRDAVTGAVNQSLAAPEIPYLIEHRVVRPDGEQRIVREMGEIERGSEGQPVYMIGTVQDITESRRIDERLQLAQRVLENAGEAIVITDAKGVIQEINPAYERIMGYSRSEVIGRKPSSTSSGRHDASFYEQMWQSLAHKGSWEGEIWDRRKNGEIFPQWLSISAISNSLGEVVNYVGIFLDISRQKAAEEKLEELAFYDGLTRLPNRTLFRDRLQQGIQAARREGEHLGLLFIDLDRFKNINDTLGHAAGDELLVQVAARIKSRVRESDTVARLGGDEFTIIVNRIENPQGALSALAKDLHTGLNVPIMLQGKELNIGASIGIAIYPNDGSDPDSMLQHADMAMYRAKESGRNDFCFYSAALQAEVHERVGIEEDLKHGLDRHELMLHYQPKVELATGRITGVEALVRWHHPERGILLPERFIPIAEESGLIVRVGEWVLNEACQQVARWYKESGWSLKLAVNLSARQVLHPDLLDTVRGSLECSGLPPEMLELELTETAVMGNFEASIKVLNALRALGVSLAIDDFGTGYSSLSYLKRLPVNTLKIDKSFVQELGENQEDASIVETIIALGVNYRLNVVAEGIETQAHLDFLIQHHCLEGQGYLFSRPVTEGELVRLLERRRAEEEQE